MALTTYAELQASIAGWIDRTDLTARIPDFITLAEVDIARWLRVSWVEKRATSVPTGAFVALPTDYTGMRNIQWSLSDRRVPLEQMSPRVIDGKSPFTASGLPKYYAIHAGQIELRPAPDASNTTELEITYYYRPTALSTGNTTNVYLEKAPDLLLFGSLIEASHYLVDDAMFARYLPRYDAARAKVLGEEEAVSWPGELSMHVG